MNADSWRPGLHMSAHGWRMGILRDRGDACPPSPATGGPVVLKVGGSLLSRPDWPALLVPLLAAVGSRSCCLVVGGGPVVDGLRALDLAVPQSPCLMHDLAIDAMRLTARLVAARVHLPLTTAPPDGADAAVLDVPAWLALGSRAATLPVGWHVTSDAIAARVAVEHGGSLLVAKSVPPPPCPDDRDLLASLARAGWVDEYFSVAAEPLSTITWAAPDHTPDHP